MQENSDNTKQQNTNIAGETPEKPAEKPAQNGEIGGQKGPEPTRYGDWEKGGRCTDF